jgi:hypothetical protein
LGKSRGRLSDLLKSEKLPRENVLQSNHKKEFNESGIYHIRKEVSMAEMLHFSVKRSPRPRKDFRLFVIILAAIVVFLIALAPIIFSLRASAHYRSFVDAYTNGMNASHQSGFVTCTVEENSYLLPVNQASEIYKKLMYYGMGKEQKMPPGEPAISIRMDDGSHIEFQETAIPESSAVRDTGLFIRFTGTDGFVYQYDTDKITLEYILKELSVQEDSKQ